MNNLYVAKGWLEGHPVEGCSSHDGTFASLRCASVLAEAGCRA